MGRRKAAVVGMVAGQALKALKQGSRFQVRKEVVGDDCDLRRLLSWLALQLGVNVRVSEFCGLLTFYDDGSDIGTDVVIAIIDQ